MRRDSIAFILRRLGLSHYTKTQVDEKVAAALLAFVTNVVAADVTAVYTTKMEVGGYLQIRDIATGQLKNRVDALEIKIGEADATISLFLARVDALEPLIDKVAALEPLAAAALLLEEEAAAAALLAQEAAAAALLLAQEAVAEAENNAGDACVALIGARNVAPVDMSVNYANEAYYTVQLDTRFFSSTNQH
jgi:hypothetical protein